MFLHAYQAVLLPIFAEAFSQEIQKSASSVNNNNKNTTMSPEEQVKEAAAACLDYWCKQQTTNAAGVDQISSDDTTGPKVVFPTALHKECYVWSLLNGTATHEGGATFCIFGRGAPSQQQPRVISVKILPVGFENSAAVHVSISNHSSNSIHGWLTLLKSSSQKIGWTCIGAAFSNAPATQVLPQHYAELTKMVWDGYCQANRACDGAAMAKVFHPTCRLTYAQDKNERQSNTTMTSGTEEEEDGIVVCPQPQFCAKVQHRYTAKEAMHEPYAKLQSHPALGRHDALLGVEFVTQDLCMVTLRVGHPPCLWTDLLTCCNLSTAGQPAHQWWIVHKSSCHEDYELMEDMQSILDAAAASQSTSEDLLAS